MRSTQKYPLAEIAHVVRGVTFSRAEGESAPFEGALPVIRAGNVQDSLILNDDLVWVPCGKISKKQIIKKNDLVMCTSSGSAALVGKCARAESDWIGSFGAFCVGIRTKEKVCDSGYLFHFLRSPDFRNWSRKSGGANIKNIRKSELEEFEIPLPPLPEQHRIAAILDKADAIRRKRQQAIRLTEEFLRSVFLDMFGDPVLNPKGFKRIVLSEISDGRDGIKCGPFGTQLLKREFMKGGIPLWGIKHVNRHFKLDTDEFLTKEKAAQLCQYSIESGDLVMTRKGTVGNCAIYPNNMPSGVMHSDLLRMRVDSTICFPEFLNWQLRISKDVEHQISLVSHGAIMAGINVTKLKKIKILLPPLPQQNKFVALVEAHEQHLNHHVFMKRQIDNLFNSLVQRAFRGEF